MKFSIDVTADDIRLGIKSDSCECPVALAFMRKVPKAKDVVVSNWTIKFYHGEDNKYLVCNLPDDARSFIKKFDSHITNPGPLSFDVEVKSYEEWTNGR